MAMNTLVSRALPARCVNLRGLGAYNVLRQSNRIPYHTARGLAPFARNKQQIDSKVSAVREFISLV
jgi:hypothetical protein